mmetsp:Transcript_26976/g.58717  ORF Transcript_26976/g.58717 Transcript_26976/m.58717 type:complete len:205 (+) Transcript_26976:1767-2381(+)
MSSCCGVSKAHTSFSAAMKTSAARVPRCSMSLLTKMSLSFFPAGAIICLAQTSCCFTSGATSLTKAPKASSETRFVSEASEAPSSKISLSLSPRCIVVRALNRASWDKDPSPDVSNMAKAEMKLSFWPTKRRRIREAMISLLDWLLSSPGPGAGGPPVGDAGGSGFVAPGLRLARLDWPACGTSMGGGAGVGAGTACLARYCFT